MARPHEAFDLLIQQAEMLLRIAAEMEDEDAQARLRKLANECRSAAEDMRRSPALRR